MSDTFTLELQKKLMWIRWYAFAILSSPSCSFTLLYTLQPLYNRVCYNTVLDITQFKDGSQKCIDYIEK